MSQYQSNFNRYVAFKAQAALGTKATGTGATILRTTGGTIGKLAKAAIDSKEVRRDALHTRGRHGLQTTTGGPYTCEQSLDAFDAIFQALLRGTYDASFTATSADYTTLTYGANSIVWAGGNPIAKGFRVNDVIELTGAEDAANNSRNVRIAGLSATTITTVETLTVNNTPDSGATITRRGRKVIMPPAGSLVNTYFTIEEEEGDIVASRTFFDCYWKSGKWSMAPNGLITFEPSWMGTGGVEFDDGSNSPYFLNPTTPTGTPMAVLDATLHVAGADAVDLTSFDLTIDNGAVAPAVAGSKTSPTVLPGQNSLSMNLKFLRKDISWDSDFLNETSLSLSVLAVPLMSEPKDFIAINVPFFTLGGADPSALSTAGGSADVTLTIPAALMGHDTTGAGYDDTMLSVQISNLS